MVSQLETMLLPATDWVDWTTSILKSLHDKPLQGLQCLPDAAVLDNGDQRETHSCTRLVALIAIAISLFLIGF